ncbi:hypothetical protein ACB098_12G092200 [Castanea mollissima]
MELKASIRILVIYFLLFLFISSAITVAEPSNVVLLTKKKSSWRGITVQMKAVLPPRVPSPPSPSGKAPPRKEIAP